MHFFRDYEDPKNRRSTVREVDFVAESIDGAVVPIEVKFRRKIHAADLAGLATFRKRFRPTVSIIVTRDRCEWNRDEMILFMPLQSFLLAF